MKWGELDERRVYEDMSIPEEMNFKTIFCAKMKEKNNLQPVSYNRFF